MDGFSIDTTKLNQQGSVLGQIGVSLGTYEKELEKIAQTIAGIGNGGFGSVSSTVRELSKELGIHKKKTKTLETTLMECSKLYVAAEMSIIVKYALNTKDLLSKIGKGISAPGKLVLAEGNTYKCNWTSGIFTTLSGMGHLGKIAKSAYTWSEAIKSGDDKKIWGAVIGSAKNYNSIFGDLAKNAFADSDKIKSPKELLFGNWTKGSAFTSLGLTTSATPSQVARAYIANELKGLDFKAATNVGEKIKVGTKWAGIALSGITNAIENVEEQKNNPEMTTGRVIAETVTETAMDYGLGLVAGAAAAAATTALLGASAPAVAVGAVAVGAVWGLNKFTEWATSEIWGEENKKDFTELASDAILDTVEAGANAVKNGFNAVTKWGKSVFGG